jgi:hypothetical protein
MSIRLTRWFARIVRPSWYAAAVCGLAALVVVGGCSHNTLAKVRRTDGSFVIGELVASRPDAIVLLRADTGTTETIPRSAIAAIETPSEAELASVRGTDPSQARNGNGGTPSGGGIPPGGGTGGALDPSRGDPSKGGNPSDPNSGGTGLPSGGGTGQPGSGQPGSGYGPGSGSPGSGAPGSNPGRGDVPSIARGGDPNGGGREVPAGGPGGSGGSGGGYGSGTPSGGSTIPFGGGRGTSSGGPGTTPTGGGPGGTGGGTPGGAPSAPLVAGPARDVTLPIGTSLALALDAPLDSDTTTVDTPVDATITAAVIVNGTTVLPVGARVRGAVIEATPSSLAKGRGRLAVRFHTLVFANGTAPIQAEPVRWLAPGLSGSDAKKVGIGAAIGGGLGKIVGKTKKTLGIGAAAGGGATAVALARKKDVHLTRGTTIKLRLAQPAAIRGAGSGS